MRAVTTDRLIHEPQRAVRHAHAYNIHARRVLRWAQNPINAATITDLLASRLGALVQALDAVGHLDEYTVLGTVLRTEPSGR